MEYEALYALSIGLYTLGLNHCTGQGRARCGCKFTVNGDRYVERHNYHQTENSIITLFHLHIYISPWPILKVMVVHVSTANVT